MLAEGLINNPVVGFGESGRKATDLKSLLLRIEESEVNHSTLCSCDLIHGGEIKYRKGFPSELSSGIFVFIMKVKVNMNITCATVFTT